MGNRWKKSDLERRADDFLKEAAKEAGVPYEEYLKQAGIVSENRERQIRRRELPLGEKDG